MPRLRVHCFSVSVDGFAAGPNQSLQNPVGVGGHALHAWLVATRTFHAMLGKEGGASGIENDFAARGFENIGAWILGRNMFGPIRGPWPDEAWKGWWGATPPYHTPVFVLTHHPRESLAMDGGTTFHFAAEGIEDALGRAFDAAQGKDVRLGGGVATIREFLRARLIDELHLVYAPVFLGSGEALLAGIDLTALGYALTAHATSASCLHVTVSKS